MAAEFGHLNLPQPERAHTASKNPRDRQRSGFGKITQPNSRISSCQGRPAERADFGSLGGPAERRFAPSTAGKRYSATPNREAAERALKMNQDLADKGDAYGLLRMGERYRDGEGVEKDIAKAKAYLQKAADAGSPTAADELKKLPDLQASQQTPQTPSP